MAEVPILNIETGEPGPITALPKRRMRSLDWLDTTMLWLIATLLAGIVLFVFLDVVTRTLGAPLLWLQEATLLCFMWGSFLGAGIGIRHDAHMHMTMPDTNTPTRKVNYLIAQAVTALIGLVLLWFGATNALQVGSSTLPVTGLSLGLFVASVPVMGGLVALFSIERFIVNVKHPAGAPIIPSNGDSL